MSVVSFLSLRGPRSGLCRGLCVAVRVAVADANTSTPTGAVAGKSIALFSA